MSLILDALRKMELERKAKRQSSREVRAEVLNYRGTTASPEKSRIIPITSALVLIFASAACFFYFTGTENPKSEAVKAAEPLQQEQPAIIRPPTPQLPPAEMPAQKSIPVKVKSAPESPKPEAKAATVTNRTGGAGITVSGIAWQDERHLRRAVINGSLVGEGVEIQGAKVVEIRENRVRFSRGGEIFEVVHSSGAERD